MEPGRDRAPKASSKAWLHPQARATSEGVRRGRPERGEGEWAAATAAREGSRPREWA